MNGIIPLKKEIGMTSADCVYKLRKILHERRIGHTGTLDPQVDGVLPICVGQATKLVNLLTGSQKEYQGEITLGYSTTTEDREGEIVERVALEETISEEKIDNILKDFIGTVKQTPPMYSAVRVDGRKLYEYARAGIEVERPVREITIYDFKRISDIKYDHENKLVKFDFDVICSKGTYVRTLAVQVGEKLNLPSHMSQLTRIKSAGLAIEQTHTLSEITEMADNGDFSFLVSIEETLRQFPTANLTASQWDTVQHGGFVSLPTNEDKVAIMYDKKIKALYKRNEYGKYQPDLMLLNNN